MLVWGQPEEYIDGTLENKINLKFQKTTSCSSWQAADWSAQKRNGAALGLVPHVEYNSNSAIFPRCCSPSAVWRRSISTQGSASKAAVPNRWTATVNWKKAKFQNLPSFFPLKTSSPLWPDRITIWVGPVRWILIFSTDSFTLLLASRKCLFSHVSGERGNNSFSTSVLAERESSTASDWKNF